MYAKDKILYPLVYRNDYMYDLSSFMQTARPPRRMCSRYVTLSYLFRPSFLYGKYYFFKNKFTNIENNFSCI